MTVPPTEEGVAFLIVPEVARLLRISVWSVYDLIRQADAIPHYRAGEMSS